MTTIDELRELIVRVAPEPELALPVRTCGVDEPLDGLVPFSSLIVLGVLVGIEDRWGVRPGKEEVRRTLEGGATLRSLGGLVDELVDA